MPNISTLIMIGIVLVNFTELSILVFLIVTLSRLIKFLEKQTILIQQLLDKNSDVVMAAHKAVATDAIIAAKEDEVLSSMDSDQKQKMRDVIEDDAVLGLLTPEQRGC